jgi:hypothetical protein
MDWFRWYTGASSDPKFQVVARKSGQNVAAVLAVWSMLLERACEAKDRGAVDGFDCEGADAILGLEDGAACSIVDAMKAKGLILNERVAKWDQRQPKREDSSSDRVRAYREREKEKCNAEKRSVTQCNARLDKRREEKDKGNCLSLTPSELGNAEYISGGCKGGADAPGQPDGCPTDTGSSPADQDDHVSGRRPKACPAEKWEKYLAYSRKFLTDQHEQLGSMAVPKESKVIAGASVLDKLIRIRGHPPEKVYRALEWAKSDPFWVLQVRSLGGLLTKGKNGEEKFDNLCAAMIREAMQDERKDRNAA